MGIVILGHIVSDFYIQTDYVADKKKESIWHMLYHCFLYFIGMYMILAVLTGNFIQGLKIAVMIALSHMCVDIIKCKIDSKMRKIEYLVFLFDQIIHIVILILICFFFQIQPDIDEYFSWQFDGIRLQKVIAILIAGLICWKPAAIFITLVFKVIPKTVEIADRVETECDCDEDENDEPKNSKKLKNAKKSSEKDSNQEEGIKIGSWIGILEREIIVILGLLGQYGAIGFVLAAKSLARYKQLENKAFAEKYLVGTLLSAFIAIASIAICSLI